MDFVLLPKGKYFQKEMYFPTGSSSFIEIEHLTNGSMGIFLFAALSKQFPTGLCPFSSPNLMTRQLQYPRKRSRFLNTATCLAEKSTSNKWVKQCLKWTIGKKLIDKLKVFVTLHYVIEHIRWTFPYHPCKVHLPTVGYFKW